MELPNKLIKYHQLARPQNRVKLKLLRLAYSAHLALLK